QPHMRSYRLARRQASCWRELCCSTPGDGIWLNFVCAGDHFYHRMDEPMKVTAAFLRLRVYADEVMGRCAGQAAAPAN
ncbi:MAG TPA: hypothetical protein VMH92_09335, partial [Acidocella sp.]|nr:hypothetical protein [Acidocella sp.]